MRIALDTNVLVYAEGVNDEARRDKAHELLARLDPAQVVLPVQVAGELFRVLTAKARRPAMEARAVVQQWQASFRPAPTTPQALAAAMDLALDHNVPLWDAVILAVAADAQCDALLSEDYVEGFLWRGVRIVDPFDPATPQALSGRMER